MKNGLTKNGYFDMNLQFWILQQILNSTPKHS